MASPPSWLARMTNRVAELICGIDVLAPIGCHYHCTRFPHNQWEVTLFVGKTEIVGGSQDGSQFSSPFTVDLEQLIAVFSEVTSFHWQALTVGAKDELGPHISVEGYFEGHSVWLRLLAEAPKQFDTSRHAHVESDDVALHDIW